MKDLILKEGDYFLSKTGNVYQTREYINCTKETCYFLAINFRGKPEDITVFSKNVVKIITKEKDPEIFL